MENSNKIDILNSLIVINNDRIEGYKTAEAEAKETDLKMLFSDLMETSVQNRKELAQEVKLLGGTTDEGTRITGKFFRVWMDVKAAFTGNDRKTILESCEYGEDVILETYQKAMVEEHFEIDVNEENMLLKQFELLESDRAKVKKLLYAIENQKN